MKERFNREWEIHDGIIAVNVKNVSIPDYPDWFEDNWFEHFLQRESEQIYSSLCKAQKILKIMFPQHEFDVFMFGRSGGWCGVRVNNVGAYMQYGTESDHDTYIGNVPIKFGNKYWGIYLMKEGAVDEYRKDMNNIALLFERLVNIFLDDYYSFWENIIEEKITKEGEES